jgi:pseudouridine-5'-phosphate glycosidase
VQSNRQAAAALPASFLASPDVERALRLHLPVVALESTVITHGLPHPQNLQLARDMEAAVRQQGATPATVALLDGKIRLGLLDDELARLARAKSPLKVSQRDLAAAVFKKASGGTTVSATMHAAHRAAIRVFATGGIGGVHKEQPFDISADLGALAGIPMIVVCAGAKAILDLPATLEVLETTGVPVVGFQTDEFPAFYGRESGLGVSARLDSPEEIAAFAQAHWSLGFGSAVLVANPIPAGEALARSEVDPIIARAAREARDRHIHGQALTPFLLQRISELSHGSSLRANLALLLNNARLAARIAKAMAGNRRRKEI